MSIEGDMAFVRMYCMYNDDDDDDYDGDDDDVIYVCMCRLRVIWLSSECIVCINLANVKLCPFHRCKCLYADLVLNDLTLPRVGRQVLQLVLHMHEWRSKSWQYFVVLSVLTIANLSCHIQIQSYCLCLGKTEGRFLCFQTRWYEDRAISPHQTQLVFM